MTLGTYNELRYVGLTETPERRFYNHPKLRDPVNMAFFAGEIVTQSIYGRRSAKRAPDFNLAEQTLASHLKPEMNERRITGIPADCVSVFLGF